MRMKKIQEIYKHNWLYSSLDETRIAYENDIQYFTTQWKLTMNENHQSIASFVGSFCEKANIPYPHMININSNAIENRYFKFKYPAIEAKYNNQMIDDKMFEASLIMCLRFFYIIYHSQNNSFPFHLQGYMRYIEMNIRYFYVYDQSDKRQFNKQPCGKDLNTLTRGIL